MLLEGRITSVSRGDTRLAFDVHHDINTLIPNAAGQVHL